VTEPSLPIALTGTEEPVAERRHLTAGPLRAILEAGALRSISFGGVEAIRGIAFVTRDRNWGTYPVAIGDLSVTDEDDAFRVTYTARCADAEQSIDYCVEITGHADGSLEFVASGTAETDFETNRTGFAVLHPLAGVVGAPCTVVHTDGSAEEATFPDLVKPSQPFLDIRAIVHEVAPGVRVTCTMEGDAYEMEDQRNWTDASFKTYIRPLSKPRPFTIPKGERIEQRVALRFDGAAPALARGGSGPITVTVGATEEGRVPELALAADPANAATDLAAAPHAHAAGIKRLVATFDAGRHGAGEMAQFAGLAEATGAALTLELVLPLRNASGAFTDDPQVLADDVARAGEAAARGGASFDTVAPLPACYLASHQPSGPWPDAPPLGAVYAATRAAFPGARIAGGMHSTFTELNRKWPPVEAIDAITHSTAAIVHAADDLSVMETLEALPSVFRTVKAHAPGKPYLVGPSAIAMRFNPYGAATMPNPGNGRIAMVTADPRQRALFNAAWTLGYIARASAGGVDGLCLSALTGPFGVVWTARDEPQPWYDEHGQEAPYFPVFHVLAGMAPHGGRAVLSALSSSPNEVAALAVDGASGREVWLANLTANERTVDLEGFSPSAVERLDAETFVACARRRDGLASTRAPAGSGVTLGAYAVARLVA